MLNRPIGRFHLLDLRTGLPVKELPAGAANREYFHFGID